MNDQNEQSATAIIQGSMTQIPIEDRYRRRIAIPSGWELVGLDDVVTDGCKAFNWRGEWRDVLIGFGTEVKTWLGKSEFHSAIIRPVQKVAESDLPHVEEVQQVYEIAALRKERDELKARVDELESDLSLKTTHVAALQSDIETLRAPIVWNEVKEGQIPEANKPIWTCWNGKVFYDLDGWQSPELMDGYNWAYPSGCYCIPAAPVEKSEAERIEEAMREAGISVIDQGIQAVINFTLQWKGGAK